MIELNCTYKESRKILELGYDFNCVCTRFTFEARGYFYDYIKIRSNFFVPDACDRVGKFGSWEDLRKWGYIPIIPKAALEACLPNIEGLDWCGFRNQPDYQLCTEDCAKLVAEFTSSYKAFLWSHEKYPEELRRKFNKEMG